MNIHIKQQIEKLIKSSNNPEVKNTLINLFTNCGGSVSALETCSDPKQYWNGEKCVDRGGDGEPDEE